MSNVVIRHKFGLKSVYLPKADYSIKYRPSEMELFDLKEEAFEFAFQEACKLYRSYNRLTPSEIHINIVDVFVRTELKETNNE